jgi:predicted secreted Zn-dependent protease
VTLLTDLPGTAFYYYQGSSNKSTGGSRIVKRLIACLLFLVAAVPASAKEQGAVDVASVDGNVRAAIMRQALEPVVTEKYYYYGISGDNEKDLRRQMTENGTKWDDGKTYDSVTSWNISWDYDYDCTAQGCRADFFNTKVYITFRYPQWIRVGEVPPSLSEKWDTYMKNLIVHENGHRDMAVNATAELARAVVALESAPSRAELDRQIQGLSDRIMAKLKAEQREYDATTIHGTTQGAVFP